MRVKFRYKATNLIKCMCNSQPDISLDASLDASSVDIQMELQQLFHLNAAFDLT